MSKVELYAAIRRDHRMSRTFHREQPDAVSASPTARFTAKAVQRALAASCALDPNRPNADNATTLVADLTA
ncbi:hypothetical protein [Streptomyces nanshensis]|uniref:hypothetical protein n=1 Tax=Streptomyces nanshensis TaxID=518642 RepID=UPI00114D192E|nr:hypothetical protein [Streptomyces nanshensis]